MTYRIPAQDLSHGGSTAQFGVPWQARIPVPISFIDDDAGVAFFSQFEFLQTGDEVTVLAFEPGTGAWRDGKAPVREIAKYRIVAKSGEGGKNSHLRAVRVGDVFEVPPPQPGLVVDGVLALDIVPAGQNIYQVRDRSGNVIEQFMGKDSDDAMKQAEEFRDREQARVGVVGFTMKKGFGKFFVCKPDGAIAAEFTTKAEADTYMRSGGQKAA